MDHKHFQQVWFVDEKRRRSVPKLVVFADRGSLELEGNSLEFKGKKLNFQISNIKNISLARQQINWVTYLIMNMLLIICFIFLLKVLPDVYSLPFLLGSLLAGNIFGLMIGYSTKWVRVEYLNNHNEISQAFFADGSSFGWSGLFGGTKQMYEVLKPLIGKEKNASS